MDADSLFRQAEKYRLLTKGINDEAALILLEQMARELEQRARRLQSFDHLPRQARNRSLMGS